MKLSVIIPSRNDTVMLGVTIRSALEELKAIEGETEIVVVDNSDEDLWKILKTPNISPLPLSYVAEGKVRLIHQPFPSLYSARQRAMDEAKGEYIVNTDSHTIYGRDVLKTVVDFMEQDKNEEVGIGFSPIGWISTPETYARHDLRPNENGSIFGPWGRQYDKPTKICWNFGFRIIRKKWAEAIRGYSFFSDHRLSYGGGEFYIALKSWLMGKENWAIPSAPIYHIGPFSKEIERRTCYRFRLYGEDGHGKRFIGLWAAYYALGGEQAREYAARNQELIKTQGLNLNGDWEYAKSLAKEDREWILANQKIDFWELLKQRPWDDGWGEDRYEQWQPSKELKKAFDLNKL